MWILIFLAALICQATAKIDPEALKPCFERYDGHKLIHSMPFHSEWKMPKEENCLEFCAQATSRCRSIVYDRISQICHYFMVDGVELRQVAPQRGMAYFQLADPNCAATAIANSLIETTTPEFIHTVTKDVNGEEIPVMFAPENFPQPPTSQPSMATSESQPTEEEESLPDFTNDDNYMERRPLKKYRKFDEKIDKTRIDEVVTYDDEGNLIQYHTSHSPSNANEQEQTEAPPTIVEEKQSNNFDDVRVPQEEQQETPINEQIETPKIGEDSDYHESTVTNKEEDIDKDYDPVPIKADKPSLLETLEPTFEQPDETTLSPTTTVATTVRIEPETSTEPPTTTPDPREEEFKLLQEQMKMLEKEVLQIREEEARKQQQKFSPKFELPKFPPSPLAFMEHSVPSILPEMKIFKVARKEPGETKKFASSEPVEAAAKVMPEIRRAPSMQQKAAVANIKPLAKAYASALNSDFEYEDSDCPRGSSLIWIGIENSDLPKIGDLITKKTDDVEDCMERCKKIRINGHVCNAFGFNEKRMECTYGFEEDRFGVKPTKASDYSTRAFKKLCYPDTMGAFRDCTEFLAFRDYKLDISPKEVFDGLPSGREGVSGCVELCVLSTNFKCRAASFDFSTNQCQLFDKYSLSNPENFKEHKSNSLLYFENGCSIEPENIKQTDINEARVQRAAINDIKIDTVLTPVRIDFRKLRA